MIKIKDEHKEYLKVFSKSKDWEILKEIIVPFIDDIERVTSSYKFDENYSAGERYAGREMASKFGRGLMKMIDLYAKDDRKKLKPEDTFE